MKSDELKAELVELQAANPRGLLVPEEALRWAKKHPQSALYKAIPWDDKKAAHQHRLWVVRSLIQVNMTTLARKPMVISLSIDRVKPGGGYRDIQSVMRDRDLREVALEDALVQLDAIRKKYDWLQELARVWEELDLAQDTRPDRREAIGAPAAPAG